MKGMVSVEVGNVGKIKFLSDFKCFPGGESEGRGGFQKAPSLTDVNSSRVVKVPEGYFRVKVSEFSG